MSEAKETGLKILTKDLRFFLEKYNVPSKELEFLTGVSMKFGQSQQKELEHLKKENERLSERDCNATVQLSYETDEYPFNKEDLKIVDVGVSDNIYIVESEIFKELQKENKELKERENNQKEGNILFLNEIKQYVNSGISKNDLKTLINQRINQID